MIYKTLKKVSEYCQILDKRTYPVTQTVNGVTFTNNGDGTITVNGTATARASYVLQQKMFFSSTLIGHKCLIESGVFLPGGDTIDFHLANWDLYANNPIGEITELSDVMIDVFLGYTANNLVFKPQLFDLTEMYGAGNEPTTVEQFRQDFPDELYDYKPYCFVKSYKTLLKATDDKIITSYKKSLVCKTKNLFPTSTAIGTLDGWSQATARQFEEDKWYIGISANNYYIPSNIIEYELTGNYVYIKTTGSGYGIGRAFKCEPNQTYTSSWNWVEITNYMQISTGFYDGNGNYLSYNAAVNLAERHTVTTPANCKWFTVCFVGNSNGSSYVYNIQLELGDTATEYHPYGYL